MAREARGGLGLGDRLILLVAWITTCGLVYLLGFYVGKGAQERRLGVEQQVLRLPVTSAPPPEGQRPKAESEFAFYDKLMGGEHAAERPGEKGNDEAKAAPPPVAAARQAPPAAAKPSPQAPAPPAVAARPTPAAAPRPAHVPSGLPAGRPAAPEPSRSASAAPGKPPAPPPEASAAPVAAPGGGWTVLVPTRIRDDADGLVKQLRGRGYDATLIRVLRDGDTWYRVQVGRFTTSEQATEMMRRLREREGVEHAFVASE